MYRVEKLNCMHPVISRYIFSAEIIFVQKSFFIIRQHISPQFCSERCQQLMGPKQGNFKKTGTKITNGQQIHCSWTSKKCHAFDWLALEDFAGFVSHSSKMVQMLCISYVLEGNESWQYLSLSR